MMIIEIYIKREMHFRNLSCTYAQYYNMYAANKKNIFEDCTLIPSDFIYF